MVTTRQMLRNTENKHRKKIQYEEADYISSGPLPLKFQRNYRSNRAPESDIFYQAENSGVPLNIPLISLQGWIRYEQPDGYYEQENQPYALTGITDENGVRYLIRQVHFQSQYNNILDVFTLYMLYLNL